MEPYNTPVLSGVKMVSLLFFLQENNMVTNKRQINGFIKNGSIAFFGAQINNSQGRKQVCTAFVPTRQPNGNKALQNKLLSWYKTGW
jgi:hypothetical protein